jgi:branched-chain amino acid transport system ATP-binding protein
MARSDRLRRRASGIARESAAPPPLEVDCIDMTFGSVPALRGVSLRVESRQMCGLIGPNGAGKTTLFNIIAGFLRPQQGRVLLHGRDITRDRADVRSRAGVRRTFQEGELFEDLTVLENVEVAADHGDRTAALEVLDEFRLTGVQSEVAQRLPAGLRRRVGVARSLVGCPRLVLMDEPGAGLVADETEELGGLIRQACSKRGCALLLVDHDMSLIRLVCEQVFVLDFGVLIAAGTPEEIEQDEKVRTAYLGI